MQSKSASIIVELQLEHRSNTRAMVSNHYYSTNNPHSHADRSTSVSPHCPFFQQPFPLTCQHRRPFCARCPRHSAGQPQSQHTCPENNLIRRIDNPPIRPPSREPALQLAESTRQPQIQPSPSAIWNCRARQASNGTIDCTRWRVET